MPGIKELKTRIKSIQSMRKITRAMQMVSAAKMRKAQTAVLNSRTYAGLSWELISKLSGKIHSSSPLLQNFPKAKKLGIVLLSTNTGLVGSLNSNLIPKIKEVVAANNLGTEIITELIIYGKKAKNISLRMNTDIMADFPKADRGITTEDIFPIAKFISDAYATGEYKEIVIIYNHYVSTLVQKASIKRLLPFAQAASAESSSDNDTQEFDSEYLFEPDPQEVLNHLLPRIIESQIFQTILESDASEHSARMVMMKNATEAAGDLINDFTLTYNQLRQAKITTELAEITAGKIALE